MFKSYLLNYTVSTLLFTGIGYIIGYIHAKRRSQILARAEFYVKPDKEVKEQFLSDMSEFITISSLESGKQPRKIKREVRIIRETT